MDRRIENIERERQKKSSKIWVFFIIVPVFGGLFYYFVDIQDDFDKNARVLEKKIDDLEAIEKDLKTVIADQKNTIDEQKIHLDQYVIEMTVLRQDSLANASSSRDKLELELEIQKKITTISNLENQITILNSQLSEQNKNKNISSSVVENRNDDLIEKINEIGMKIEKNIPEPPSNNDISIPNLVSSIPPKYPSRALQRNLSGEVELVFDIDQFGKPLNIRILNSSSRLFEPSAISAIEKAVYTRPIDKNGNPVRYLDMTKKYVWKLD